jgi:hypothetical protein
MYFACLRRLQALRCTAWCVLVVGRGTGATVDRWSTRSRLHCSSVFQNVDFAPFWKAARIRAIVLMHRIQVQMPPHLHKQEERVLMEPWTCLAKQAQRKLTSVTQLWASLGC